MALATPRLEESEVPVRFEIPTRFAWPSAEEVEQRFEERIRGRWNAREASIPADVFLSAGEVVVVVDLPGVPLGDVQLRASGAALVIEATRRVPASAGEARPARLERPRGPVHRVVPLPRRVQETFEVELEEGVLVVRLRVENPA
jgi:HSP20 family molecular chaperone IbpA